MKTTFLPAVTAACLIFVGTASAQNYSLDWFSIDGGGGTSTGGPYGLDGTIGQPDAGFMSGGAYSLAGGFWAVTSAAVPPLLGIEPLPGGVRVFWPRSAAGFVLDETMALASSPPATAWTPVPVAAYQTNSTHISITVPMPSGNRFYRLRQ